MLKTTDKYGVEEYNKGILLAIFILIMAVIVLGAGWLLYLAEAGAVGANLLSYGDSIWTVWMAASTIGFGDFYPVTLAGRFIIGSMFVVGAINLGLVIGVVSSWFTSHFDNSIPNRELKRQLDIVIMKLDRLETHEGVDQTVKWGWDEHGLDEVISQKRIHLTNTLITLGRDDSGIYVVCINDKQESGFITMEKFTFPDEQSAEQFYDRQGRR